MLRLTDGPADVLLLGWVGPDHALAVLDDDFSDARADVVLLALDAEAGEADGTVVGHVSYADVAGDLSYATDLASVTSPTRDFPTDPAKDDPGDDSAPGTAGLSIGALVGVGAATLALAAAFIVAVRRRRSPARPS